MNTITTQLVPDGDSMVIRIPKQEVARSGLVGVVLLTIESGQITIRMPQNPRTGWERQIKEEIDANGPISSTDIYSDMRVDNQTVLNDGIEQCL